MNKIILMGRLTRDPEVRYTTTGRAVCQFALAVNRPFTNQDGQREADFINIIIWGKSAEIAGNSLSKGQRVLIEGRLQIRSYDGKDNKKHYVTEVITNSFEFIEAKNYQSGTGNKEAPSVMDSFSSDESFDEEIPF